MKQIEYNGYIVSQAESNHIMIIKDEDMVFHASATKKLTDEELKNQVELFMKLQGLIESEDV